MNPIPKITLSPLALALALAASSARAQPVSPATPDRMAAHYIDVGQGAAVLLEFSCGAVLIDTGGQADPNIDGNARFMAYLAAFFARRTDLNKAIDTVFLSHDHADHTSGAGVAPLDTKPPIVPVPQTAGLIPPGGSPPLYAIRSVVTNREVGGSGTAAQQALLAWAGNHGVPTRRIGVADITHPYGLEVSPALACKGVSPVIRVLWGSSHTHQAWQSDGNNQSLVIRVDFGASSFLFLGDLEDKAHPSLIQAFADVPSVLDVDVLLAPHHGSKNGTTPELVNATTPEIAVIAAGDPSLPWPGFSAREFGHPNKAVIDLFQNPKTGNGVTGPRTKMHVPVGLNGRSKDGTVKPKGAYVDIKRAIYATGWDGDIVITADKTGAMAVDVSKP